MYKLFAPICCVFVFIAMIFFSGCTAAIVGAGEKAYTHIRGDLLGITPEKLDNVYAASLKAVEGLNNYHIVEQKVTAINGTIVAYDHDAEKLSIDLSKTEHDNTRIQIRIGAFGDKVKSVYIYDCIQRHLRDPQKAQAAF